jgi:hypothetical protein
LGTTTVNNLATIFSCHARTETVAAFANKVARLISTFHILTPARAAKGIRLTGNSEMAV